MQYSEEKTHLKSTFKKVFRAENILPAFLIFLVVYGAIMLLFGRNSVFRYISNLKEREAVLHEIKQLKSENDRLYKEIEDLKHDRFLIEKLARENLGLVKENDEIFVIVGDKPKKEEKKDRWIDKVKNIYREYYLNR